MSPFETVAHRADLCVVGGGLSGLATAISAARHGAKVVLMQERPMLGGNASSEIRMWVCGAQGANMRETGLVEEWMLENCWRNPDRNYSVWDGILYESARNEKNITLLLNCSCNDCAMEANRIVSVTGWQMTTQTFHRVEATLFADCSGDSVLAPLSGAQWRMGREGRDEHGEDIAPARADRRTMGMSCMIQAREEDHASVFTPPKWAYHYTKKDLPHRVPDMTDPNENFWYLELGGENDAIRDTETLRDELLKTAYGMWDFVKNDPENREKNRFWRLDWVGILPGKRESRRYVGDYVMTQNDVRAEGRFDDLVAYGGWSMDDHHPGGFLAPDEPTIFHPAPSPYGIPYRCLYSVNVDNLFFAGRNISVTHTAMSSTRVMGTCAICGQAAGTAAAIAVKYACSPRQVYQYHLRELQDTLMDDDCYLPFRARRVPSITRAARLVADASDAENLRNGLDRPVRDEDNGAMLALGASATYVFPEETDITRVRVVFDSDLNRATFPEEEARRHRNMLHNRPLGWPDVYPPKTLVRAFRIEGLLADGGVKTLCDVRDNHQRLFTLDCAERVSGVRLTPIATWGASAAHIFSFDAR